jgi:hypothetical protein
VFAKIDENCTGNISFDEFCNWAISQNLRSQSDDYEEFPCSKKLEPATEVKAEAAELQKLESEKNKLKEEKVRAETVNARLEARVLELEAALEKKHAENLVLVGLAASRASESNELAATLERSKLAAGHYAEMEDMKNKMLLIAEENRERGKTNHLLQNKVYVMAKRIDQLESDLVYHQGASEKAIQLAQSHSAQLQETLNKLQSVVRKLVGRFYLKTYRWRVQVRLCMGLVVRLTACIDAACESWQIPGQKNTLWETAKEFKMYEHKKHKFPGQTLAFLEEKLFQLVV